MTAPWEKLYPGARNILLSIGTQYQQKVWREIAQKDETLWRADISLNQEMFNEAYRGTIPVQDWHFSPINPLAYSESIVRIILQKRLTAQDILRQTFQLLDEHARKRAYQPAL